MKKEDGRREVKAVCKMPPAAFAACGLCKRWKMAKKRQVQQKGKQDEKVRLEDALQKDVLEKLRQAKQELAAAEAEKKRAEEERKRKERKQRERNKSFAELLEESDLDWKRYKG